MKRRDFLKGLGIFSALLLAGGGALAEGMRTDMHDETSMETIGADGFGKMLIAYYSLTGHTRAAAQKIQELTGADLMEIHPKDPYPVSHDPCLKRQMQEIETDARPALAEMISNLPAYDTICIGYPIWYYQAPMALNTFVEQQDFSGKVILPFCTSGGYEIGPSVEILKPLAPDARWMEGLRVRGDVKEIQAWLQQAARKERA